MTVINEVLVMVVKDIRQIHRTYRLVEIRVIRGFIPAQQSVSYLIDNEECMGVLLAPTEEHMQDMHKARMIQFLGLESHRILVAEELSMLRSGMVIIIDT